MDPLFTFLLQFNMIVKKSIRDSYVNREGHTLYESHRMIGYTDDLMSGVKKNGNVKMNIRLIK